MTRDNEIVAHVIKSVAAADGVDASELDALYEHIDPDVLELLAEQDRTEWSFTFQYLDHQVTVTHDGQIRVDGVVQSRNITLG